MDGRPACACLIDLTSSIWFYPFVSVHLVPSFVSVLCSRPLFPSTLLSKMPHLQINYTDIHQTPFYHALTYTVSALSFLRYMGMIKTSISHSTRRAQCIFWYQNDPEMKHYRMIPVPKHIVGYPTALSPFNLIRNEANCFLRGLRDFRRTIRVKDIPIRHLILLQHEVSRVVRLRRHSYQSKNSARMNPTHGHVTFIECLDFSFPLLFAHKVRWLVTNVYWIDMYERSSMRGKLEITHKQPYAYYRPLERHHNAQLANPTTQSLRAPLKASPIRIPYP